MNQIILFITYQAFKGFHWSQCMPASVGGPMPEGVQLCPKAHFGYMVSGKMKVIADSGEEKVIGAGDVSVECKFGNGCTWIVSVC